MSTARASLVAPGPRFFLLFLSDGSGERLACTQIPAVVVARFRYHPGARSHGCAVGDRARPGVGDDAPCALVLAASYVLVFRNSPLLVQLLFWYFGVATLLPETAMTWLNAAHTLSIGPVTLGWPSFEFVAGWFGLTCYSTAFIGEEFRAGLRGVPGGQYHAAAALGLGPFTAMRYVILPQALRIALPPLFGQYMNIVKNSSLTMAIGLAELSYASRQVDTETFKTFQAFGAATVLYIATIALIEVALAVFQHRGARMSHRS